MENENLISKIQKLLAKASAEGVTEEEAELLTAKATALMAKYSIDAAMLAAKAKSSTTPTRTIIFTEGTYGAANQYMIYRIADAFGAACVYVERPDPETGMVRDGTEVFGYESDIDMIRLLYTSLTLQCANLVKNIKGTGSGETRYRRRSFIYGFAAQVGDRLTAQRQEATIAAEDSTPGTSTALVLMDRAALARKAKEKAYPKLKTSKRSALNDTYYSHGRAAGEKADLHDKKAAGHTTRIALR